MPPEVPDDPRFVAAEDALEAGEYALAAQRYQAILDAEPANAEAASALGQVRLLQRLDEYGPDVVSRADADPDDLRQSARGCGRRICRDRRRFGFSRAYSVC